MRTIFRYDVDIYAQTVSMPVNAVILPHVVRSDRLSDVGFTIWAECDPLAGVAGARKIFVVGTGGEIPEGAVKYIGTFISAQYVWHVYEGASVS